MVAYYVIALPLGAWVTFSLGWGLEGMWLGLTIALAISSIGGLVLCGKTNWEFEVARVQERMNEGQTMDQTHHSQPPMSPVVGTHDTAHGSAIQQHHPRHNAKLRNVHEEEEE